MFVTQTGNYVSPREFLRYLQNAAAELDLPPRTCLHSLRHTAATIWLESGRMHVRAVADALGHSSTSVTTDIYTHTSPAVAAAGADILGAVLTPEEAGETR